MGKELVVESVFVFIMGFIMGFVFGIREPLRFFTINCLLPLGLSLLGAYLLSIILISICRRD